MLQVGGATYFYAARMGESTIHTYAVAANGSMVLVGSRVLDGPLAGIDIAALTPVTVGGNRFLVSLSLEADVVRAFPVAANGTLGPPQLIGAPQGLGIADPSAVKVVEMAGATYLLVASAGSSSISVIGLGADGSMQVADHVIDTLDTRFQGVQALATAQIGDRTFVIAGGGDDGLTVMVLTPEGRLLPCGQMLQAPGLALDNITAMTARVTGGMIELFVTGEGTGITRLQIDPGTLSPVQQGGPDAAVLNGSASADMILGEDGDEVVQGGAGADILGDGGGSDTLSGGADADLFVLSADGARDRIDDFQPGIDRIDLSAWGRVHSLAALEITATATGALITWGDEVLELVTPNGLPRSPGSFRPGDFTGLWHALPAEPELQNTIYGTNQPDLLTGTEADEMFILSAGADTILGGAGFDCIVLSGATAGVRVNLDNPGRGTNIATGQSYLSIEGIIGSDFSDNLTGNAADNRIEGRDSNDRLGGAGGADSLFGGNGSDTLSGGAGADLLDGGIGRDRVSYRDSASGLTADLGLPSQNTGEAAGDSFVGMEDLEGTGLHDTLGGDSQPNAIYALDGNDRIEGRLGNDSLYGAEGDDTLSGGAGADRLDGGTGFDIASFETATTAIRIDLMSAALAMGEASGDMFISIEGFRLSDLADSFAGTDLADRGWGGAGNDTLTGRGGPDWLAGGAGNDLLYGGDGDDTLIGGAGVDRLEGALGLDLVSYADAAVGLRVDLTTPSLNTGDAKGDIHVGLEGLEGSDHGDTLGGDATANRILGGYGNDQLFGRTGNDSLSGGDGDDTLSGGAGADRLSGGVGLDLASYAESRALRVDLAQPGLSTGEALGDQFDGIEGLLGGTGNDTLLGDGQANLLIGGGGADQIDGRTADDTLLGGDGADTLWGGDGVDRLEGGVGNDRLEGGAGDDVLLGGDGNDLILAEAGSDLIDGGAGIDTASYAAWLEVLVLDLAQPGLNAGAAAGDVLIGIEAVTGTGLGDRIAGDGLANTLRGEAGADWLSSGAGNDLLYGGDGDDTVIGGGGADRLDGGLGRDRLSYADAAQGLWVDMASGSRNTGDAKGDVLVGIEDLEGSGLADTLAGNSAANLILGLDGNDQLSGQSGNDSLIGGLGDDTLSGGSGADRLEGGEGLDLASYALSRALRVDLAQPGLSTGEALGDQFDGIEGLLGGTGNDTLLGDSQANLLIGGGGADVQDGRAGNDTLAGGIGSDTLAGGEGNDLLDGGTSNDRLDGGAGDDLLTGGDGNDLLDGGAGNDVLTGGLGVDTFVFIGGADLVTDFRDGQDKITLALHLWEGPPPVVASLLSEASVSSTGLHLDFGGGNTLDIAGIFDANLLADDIRFL
jgi:Ca2+-binding RTX toxin-like protein